MNEPAKHRAYHSERRRLQAEETRNDVITAARRLFANEGYGRVSIPDIAREAKVSVKTVYSSVGSKRDILTELSSVIDLSGQVVPLNVEISECTDPEQIIRLAARLRRLMMEGAGDIVKMIADAGVSEEEVQELYEHGQHQSYQGAERIIDRLLTVDAPLTMERQIAIDSLYSLMHWRMYDRMVNELGWTVDQFEQWQGDILIASLLERRDKV